MAVALSLLIILPALAENTNGQVTQGRGTDNELIVGVYDPEEIDGVRNPSDVDLGSLAADAGDLRTIPGSPTEFHPHRRQIQTGTADGDSTPVDAAFVNAAEDTFFNGKLYVSNRHDPFENGDSVEGGYNTVLVTQLGAVGAGCLTVTVKNTRSGGASIKLALVPSDQGRTLTGTVGNTGDNRYFQNYFRVADADLDLQD